MASILILGPAYQEKISNLRRFAERHPVSFSSVQAMAEGKEQAVGESMLYRVELDRGFRIVYSIEHQAIGACRHLSVSVTGKNKLPNVACIEQLMEDLGFDGPMSRCKVWVENGIAVNVLQLIKIGGPRVSESQVQSVSTQ